MKKTSVFIIFLFLLTSGLFLYFLIPKSDSKIVSTWKTYVRLEKSPQVSMSYPTTILELSLTKTTESRSPASNPAFSSKVKINGRDIYGDGAESIKSEEQFLENKDNYYFENGISDTWERNFADNQLRFLDADTKLMIKKDASLVQIKKNRVRYLEVITVNVIKDLKFSNSFTAMVDSQTGQLVNTWNVTLHENNNEIKALRFPTSE
jgi:hypothetical protein